MIDHSKEKIHEIVNSTMKQDNLIYSNQYQSNLENCQNFDENQSKLKNIRQIDSLIIQENTKIENPQKFSVREAKKLLEKKINIKKKQEKFSNENHMIEDEPKEKEESKRNTTTLRQKYYNLKSRGYKRYFQVVYIFKKKKKRMYRIDCMTRKINVNFFYYIKENQKTLQLNEELIEFFKSNIKYTCRETFKMMDIKYPFIKDIYQDYLKSEKFSKMITSIKNKYDEEYLKLFFRHSQNFLNFYLKDSAHSKLGRKLGSKNLKTRLNNDDEIKEDSSKLS